MKIHIIILSITCLSSTILSAAHLNRQQMQCVQGMGSGLLVMAGLHHLATKPAEKEKQRWYHSRLISLSLLVAGGAGAVHATDNVDNVKKMAHRAQVKAANALPTTSNYQSQKQPFRTPIDQVMHDQMAADIAQVQAIAPQIDAIAARTIDPRNPLNFNNLASTLQQASALAITTPETPEQYKARKATAKLVAQVIIAKAKPGPINWVKLKFREWKFDRATR